MDPMGNSWMLYFMEIPEKKDTGWFGGTPDCRKPPSESTLNLVVSKQMWFRMTRRFRMVFGDQTNKQMDVSLIPSVTKLSLKTRSLAKVKVYWNKFLLYCIGTRTLAQAFWSIVDIPNLAIMSSMAVAWVFDISACTLWPHIDGLRLHIDGPEESSERKGTTCYCGRFVCHFNCVAPGGSFKDHGFLQSICQTTWHPNCFESISAITGSRSPTLDQFDAVKDISELALETVWTNSGNSTTSTGFRHFGLSIGQW